MTFIGKTGSDQIPRLEAFFDEASERARKIWSGYEIVSRGQTLQSTYTHSSTNTRAVTF